MRAALTDMLRGDVCNVLDKHLRGIGFLATNFSLVKQPDQYNGYRLHLIFTLKHNDLYCQDF